MPGEFQPIYYIEGLDKPAFRFEEDIQEGGGVLFCNVCGTQLAKFGPSTTRKAINETVDAHWCPRLGQGAGTE